MSEIHAKKDTHPSDEVSLSCLVKPELGGCDEKLRLVGTGGLG